MEDDDYIVNFSPFLFIPGWIKLPSRKTTLAEKPSSLSQSHDCNCFNLKNVLKIIQEKKIPFGEYIQEHVDSYHLLVEISRNVLF